MHSIEAIIKKFSRSARPDFFLQSSRNRVDLLSYDSKTTDKREQIGRSGLSTWKYQFSYDH